MKTLLFSVFVSLASCGGAGTYELELETPYGDATLRYIKVPVPDPVCQDRLAECLATVEMLNDECVEEESSWGEMRNAVECDMCPECCGTELEEGDPGFMGPDATMMLGGEPDED